MSKLDGGLLDNVEDVIGLLDDLEFSAVPFAAMKTLTGSAVEGQAEVRRKLPDQFNIRRNRVAKGIRIKPAKKTYLESAVYTMDWYMKDQQEGGVRGAKSGRSRLIPTLNVRQGETIKGGIKRGMRPRAVLKRAGLLSKLERGSSAQANVGSGGQKKKKRRKGGKPKAFMLTLKSGKKGLFLRPKRGASNIELIYALQDKVKVKGDWGLDKTVSRIANAGFRDRFLMNLQVAFESDRKKPGRRAFLDAFMRER